MRDGMRVQYKALRAVWVQGYTYIWANLAFVVLSLPLVTAPAAFRALMQVVHTAHTDPSEADLSLFWVVFRAELLRTLPWGLAHAAFGLVNFGNLLAYADAPGPLYALLRTLWLTAGLVWLAVMLFTWPIYFEMESPTLMAATRNAVLMVALNPLFTLSILSGVILLSVLSTVLVASWLLLTWGCIAAIANAAVLNRLTRYRDSKVKGHGVN